MGTLTWCLAIATYKRHQVLLECVKRAVSQTHKPAEVVVVDASPDWEQGAIPVAEVCRAANIPCQYVQARLPSLAVQRNQAIDLSKADVLFMIDDDSMLFPEAAEHVMAVYEADTRGLVAGVQLITADEDPPPLEGADGAKLESVALKATGSRDMLTRSSLGRLFYREILLMSREHSFVPYLGSYPDHPIPDELAALGVSTTRLFTGCAMTYRRSVISEVRFNSLLRSYCPAEDLDASYRVSLKGCLVVAPKARLRHIEAAAGRIRRRVATSLWACNIALFLRQNATGDRARQRDFSLLILRRVIAEVIKDAGSKRFDFPQLRGLLEALPICYKVFSIPDAELEGYFAGVQSRLLGLKA